MEAKPFKPLIVASEVVGGSLYEGFSKSNGGIFDKCLESIIGWLMGIMIVEGEKRGKVRSYG